MLVGSLVAIVTPMHEDGSLDFAGMRQLVDFHVNEGTAGIVVVGTTGESPTVNVEEHCELIRIVVEHAAGRVPVIAGTGGNSTAEAIELSRFAKAAGATGSLSVVPYYNKPTQEGLYRHFKSIAEAIDLPVLLYNVPGRSVADLGNDTILRLAKIPNIIGVKDATGSIPRACDLIRRAPKDFILYSGDDMTCLPFILLGGHGTISVTANVAPEKMQQMCLAALAGKVVEARTINESLLGLHQHLFCEANPIPVKWALNKMGLINKGMRLPLTELSASFHDEVMQAMKMAAVI